jgi:hypothetical protein
MKLRFLMSCVFCFVAGAFLPVHAAGMEDSEVARKDASGAVATESEQSAADDVAGRAEAEKLICRPERQIGSNRTTRVCRTRAQINTERERSQGSTSISPAVGAGRDPLQDAASTVPR